jgi:ABC-type multidrug transport system ATPase subunit
MTSWEALSFYASIILPPSTSGEEKRHRIKEVLAMMGLAQHKDTLVRCDTMTRVTCGKIWSIA